MLKRNRISGQFAARLIEMMESPAYRILSLSAHRALSRIEIEWAHHGGQDNGKLPVTFDDFERYGLHRRAIGPALAELEALGFIVITEHGKMSHAADYRRPNKFLLTSRPTQKGADPLHKWRQFKTLEDAFVIAEAARKSSEEKKNEPVRKTHQRLVRKTPCEGEIASAENAPPSGAENAPLSISRTGTLSMRDTETTTIADDAPTLGGVLHSNAPAATSATPPPKLVWSRPVVRELFGAEAAMRRAEIRMSESVQLRRESQCDDVRCYPDQLGAPQLSPR